MTLKTIVEENLIVYRIPEDGDETGAALRESVVKNIFQDKIALRVSSEFID